MKDWSRSLQVGSVCNEQDQASHTSKTFTTDSTSSHKANVLTHHESVLQASHILNFNLNDLLEEALEIEIKIQKDEGIANEKFTFYVCLSARAKQNRLVSQNRMPNPSKAPSRT